MNPVYAEFWDGPQHSEFVSELNADRVRALRDLLLIATLVDNLFTIEERVEVAYALADLPGLDETVDFDSAIAIDHVDELGAHYDEAGDELLDRLLSEIGDTLDLSHALEAVIVLMATNDNSPREAMFARRLGVMMGVPDEFVEELLVRYGWAE